MAETDLTVWTSGLRLPPGWSVRGVSIIRPYGYGLSDLDELEVEFVFYDALLTIQTTLSFTKRGFKPDWLYEYLTLLEKAPHGVESSRTYHERRMTYGQY